MTRFKAAGTRIHLTSPFEPLELRESAGMFANPFAEAHLKIETKLGFALQELITQNGFALSDDDATEAIEYTQLSGSVQGGAEAEATLSGAIGEPVTWTLGAGLFYPFFVTAETDLEGVELFDVHVSAKVSVRLWTYLSLDWVLLLKRQPLILDDLQIQNTVLVTARYELLSPAVAE